MLRIVSAISLFIGIAAMHACDAEDLSRHYTATLVPTAPLTGYDWTCEARDAWRLKSFSIQHADALSIEFDAAQVVFGKHKSDVLWAVVVPDEPGTIVRASAGQGERVTSVWLRFHPARLGEFFPNETVLGQKDEPNVKLAKQIAQHKLRSSYHVGGRPAVVPMHHLIVDCETTNHNRRFFVIDSKEKSVQYVDAFRQRFLPLASHSTNGKLADSQATEVFDKAWSEFDRHYAMFAVKPDVDWNKLRDQFRPQAANVNDNRELAEVINQMLIHLQDLHIHVQVDGVKLPGFRRERPLNANVQAVERLIGKVTQVGPELRWAIADGNIGYIRIEGLSNPDLYTSFKNVLHKMNETNGLIMDLRFNGGGSETIAQDIASHFLDRERVYAISRYRSGPKHTDLTENQARSFSPHKSLVYDKRVVVLQGQRTMSSAEAMTLMMKQCPSVITMGDRTAGSSGNPAQVPCGAGITVNLPRWIPMDADGKSFDTVGIQPDKEVPAEPRDFTAQSDPVLQAAITHLRSD
ncbi:MAG: S41 family peptidase [Pirellulaceae bacterium]